jgi:hypothetical protein
MSNARVQQDGLLTRLFLRYNVLLIQFKLRKVSESCIRTPYNALCPCTSFESLVNGRGEFGFRRKGSGRLTNTGEIVWFVNYLVFPIRQKHEVKCSVVQRKSYRNIRLFSFLAGNFSLQMVTYPIFLETYLKGLSQI